MIWAGIQKTSTIDFPSCLSCVLFTAGCDINCFYCHNRALIKNVKSTISNEEIMSFLEKRKGLLDGVVVSGGEPTLQKDLIDFLKTLKEMGYKTKLDSNGRHKDVIENAINENLLDYIAIDIKALPSDYEDVCGVDAFESVKSTVDYLLKSGIDFEVRTTLYPQMTTEKLEELFKLFPQMPRWRLNFYNMPEVYEERDLPRLQQKALTKVQIDKISNELKSIQPNLIY